ncbi:hypothetical protein ACO0RG_001896 [Hanseniaspora osmophila]
MDSKSITYGDFTNDASYPFDHNMPKHIQSIGNEEDDTATDGNMGIFGMTNESELGLQEPHTNQTVSVSNAKPITTLSSSISFTNRHGRKIMLKRKNKVLESDVKVDSTHGSKILFTNNDNQFSDFVGKKNIITGDSEYGININELLDNINKNKNKLLLQRNEKVESCEATNSEDVLGNTQTQGAIADKLWVEKYRPNSFFNLVGNEKLNRRILKWLKHWDPVVFAEALNDNFYDKEDLLSDPFQRPSKKILMIHGPPGIGKTSVAHVLATQCGFNIMEINASDERSGDKIKMKLNNILFNQSFNGKPNVLVCDEIDGAIESGFIKYLLDILQADNKATQQYVTASSSFSHSGNKTNLQNEKKKHMRRILKRPIIAICNNLYSKPLEKLRQHCEIIPFNKPSEKSVADRLEDVLCKENLQITKKSMMKMIEICDSDIRNCLNNLQFLSMNATADEKSPPNSSNIIDLFKEDSETLEKDIPLAWYQVVNQIFQKFTNIDSNTMFANLMNKLELQNSSSNIERIINGCFDNYHKVRYSDVGLQKPSKVADWLHFYDTINKSMYSGNNEGHELGRYATTVPMIFHQFFGDVENSSKYTKAFRDNNNSNNRSSISNFQFNNIHFELLTHQKKVESMINSMRNSISPCQLLVFYNKHMSLFNLEVAPYLSELLNTEYLKTIKNPVTRNTVMSESVLPLLQHFHIFLKLDAESATKVKMYPPLNELATIDPVINLNHRNQPEQQYQHKSPTEAYKKSPVSISVENAHKHIIAKLEELKIKNMKHSPLSSSASSGLSANGYNKQNERILKRANPSEDQIENKKRKVNDSKDGSASKTVDFFKKKYASTPSSNVSAKLGPGQDGKASYSGRIWVKYKEGFSNAVRKKITWETFFE